MFTKEQRSNHHQYNPTGHGPDIGGVRGVHGGLGLGTDGGGRARNQH